MGALSSSRLSGRARSIWSGIVVVIVLLLALAKPAKADIVPGSDPDLTPPTTIVTTPPPPAVGDQNPNQDQTQDDDGEQRRRKPLPPSLIRGFGAVGASNGSVFGIRSNAVHVGGGLTVDPGPHLAVPISLELDVGESPSGLKMTELALAFGIQGVIANRVRIGGGMELSHMWISRPHVTRTIGAVGTGAFILASVDLISFEKDRAIFVGVRPVVSWRWGSSDLLDVSSGAPTWRVAGVLGARF